MGSFFKELLDGLNPIRTCEEAQQKFPEDFNRTYAELNQLMAKMKGQAPGGKFTDIHLDQVTEPSAPISVSVQDLAKKVVETISVYNDKYGVESDRVLSEIKATLNDYSVPNHQGYHGDLAMSVHKGEKCLSTR